MAEQSRWQRIKSRPVETYNKTWLGFIAIAVIGALVGGMLLVKAIGFGYTTYTAKFAQAASLRAAFPPDCRRNRPPNRFIVVMSRPRPRYFFGIDGPIF